MTKSQYFKLYNYSRKFREPPVEGLFFQNIKNCEGANENLPFFICFNPNPIRGISWQTYVPTTTQIVKYATFSAHTKKGIRKKHIACPQTIGEDAKITTGEVLPKGWIRGYGQTQIYSSLRIKEQETTLSGCLKLSLKNNPRRKKQWQKEW